MKTLNLIAIASLIVLVGCSNMVKGKVIEKKYTPPFSYSGFKTEKNPITKSTVTSEFTVWYPAKYELFVADGSYPIQMEVSESKYNLVEIGNYIKIENGKILELK